MCHASNAKGLRFFDAALLASWSDEARDHVHEILAPGALQPELPCYPVSESTELYVPMVVLRRVADADEACVGVFGGADLDDIQAAASVWGPRAADLSRKVSVSSFHQCT